MNIRLDVICLLVLLSGTAFQPKEAPKDAILGEWLNQDKDGKVTFYRSGDKYYGKVSWTKIPGKKDEKNPDPEARKKEVMGLVILEGFMFKDGSWKGGTIYDPKSGKTYDGLIKVKNGNRDLEIRGFLGSPLFGRTIIWTRP